jgi:hypothetical protein
LTSRIFRIPTSEPPRSPLPAYRPHRRRPPRWPTPLRRTSFRFLP